jgi:hypothetical protein
VFKKLRLFNLYRRTIKECEAELSENFRLEKDLVYRLYTVVNIDPKLVEQYYTEDISGPVVKDFVIKVDRYMRAKGLGELVALRDVQPLDNFNVKVVMGFSLFDTAKAANRLIAFGIIGLIALIATFIIL